MQEKMTAANLSEQFKLAGLQVISVHECDDDCDGEIKLTESVAVQVVDSGGFLLNVYDDEGCSSGLLRYDAAAIITDVKSAIAQY